MAIWIREQDGESLIKLRKSLGTYMEGDGKYQQQDIRNCEYSINVDGYIMGYYESQERTFEIISEIEHLIEENSNKDIIYRLPEK